MNATATTPKTVAELKQEQSVLIQSLDDLKDLSKMEELMASLKAVKKQVADIEDERNARVGEASTLIVTNGIKLSELTEAARQMLGAVVARQSAAPTSTKKDDGEDKRERAANDLHPFGFIPFKDFGFTTTVATGKTNWTKETGLNWVMGQVYGPTPPTEFLQMVRAKVQKDGIAILDKHMSEDFKKWIDEGREGQGPAKGRTLYKNRDKFYSFFGLDKDGKPDPKNKNFIAATAEVKPAKKK